MGYKQLLPHNRGFELGNSTQFSISGAGSNGVYTTSVGEGSYAWQLYASINEMAAGDVSEEIITDAVVGAAGQKYLVGMYAAMLANYRSGSACSRSLEGQVKFFNAGGTEISNVQLFYAGTKDAFPETFTWYEQVVTAPALTASIKLWAKVRVWKPETDPAQQVYRQLGVDGFSIKQYLEQGGAVDLSGYGVA